MISSTLQLIGLSVVVYYLYRGYKRFIKEANRYDNILKELQKDTKNDWDRTLKQTDWNAKWDSIRYRYLYRYVNNNIHNAFIEKKLTY